MEIKTNFNLDQEVFRIMNTPKKVTKTCPLCKGMSRVKLEGTDRQVKCPDCSYDGMISYWEKTKWIPLGPSFIGRIGIVRYSKSFSDHKDETQYMLDDTGIGSGSLWNEEDLFATREEAEKECELRNEKLGAK